MTGIHRASRALVASPWKLQPPLPCLTSRGPERPTGTRHGHVLGSYAGEAVPPSSVTGCPGLTSPWKLCTHFHSWPPHDRTDPLEPEYRSVCLFHGWPHQGRSCPGVPGQGSCAPSVTTGLPLTGRSLGTQVRNATNPSSMAGLPRGSHSLESQARGTVPLLPWLDSPWPDMLWQSRPEKLNPPLP